MTTTRLLVTLGALAALTVSTASAVTLALNSTADTYLRNNENQSYGAATSILAGSHSTLNAFTSLFRFDLSLLPTSGITIDSVTLTLTSTSNGAGATVTLNVFQLAAANAGWVEGNANGTVVNGFSSARQLITGSTEWAGGVNSFARTAGTDYINTSLASFTGNASTIGTGTLGFTGNAAFLTSVGATAGGNLDLWVGTPTLTGANDFFRIASKETGTQPSLTINYTAIPEPNAFAALAGLGAVGLVALRRRRA